MLQGLEMPCLEVLLKMEQQGVKIDENVLHKQTKELTKKISTLESKSFELAGEISIWDPLNRCQKYYSKN